MQLKLTFFNTHMNALSHTDRFIFGTFQRNLVGQFLSSFTSKAVHTEGIFHGLV